MSNVWDVYNQWQYVKGLINSFYVVVKPEFYTVVMKQYSSEDYIERECCRFCAPDMTRVLKQGEWDEDDWSAAADFTYTNITNCDTHTYGALIQTVDKWDEKRAELVSLRRESARQMAQCDETRASKTLRVQSPWWEKTFCFF